MRKNTSPLLMGILIIFLLSVGVAFMRFTEVHRAAPLNTQTSAQRPKLPAGHAMSEGRKERLEQFKNQELLGLSSSSGTLETFPGAPALSARSARGGKTPQSQHPSAAAPGTIRPQATSASSAENRRAANPAGTSGEKTPQMQGGTAAPVAGRTAGSNKTSAQNNLSAQNTPAARQEPSHVFAPMLRGLTRDQSDLLNRTLGGLAANVERAILQASLPKSQRDANIEKYLNKYKQAQGLSTQDTSAQGPFAAVLKQVSSQKATIEQSMKQAYGSAAAGEAGKLMDSYQNELSALLANTDGKTPEDLAKAARAISQKYNKKLDSMSQKYGLKKFKQNEQTKTKSYLADIEKTYDGEVAAEIGALHQKALAQKMQLAQETGLTTQEAYDKYLEIERNTFFEEEKLLMSHGYSSSKLTDIKFGKDQQERAQHAQEEKDGTRVAQVYRMSQEQQRSYLDTIQKMNEDSQQKDVAAFGEEGAQAFAHVYARYMQKVAQIIADPETSADEKEAALQQASAQANKERARIKNTPQMREQQVNATLGRIFQDPALQDATPQQRQAFEQLARPVLQDMFEQAAQIEESDLSEQEKRQRLKELDEETRRKLSGGL